MKITTKEQKILKQAAAINQRLREDELRKNVNALRKLVGKCYRFRNSYGCGDAGGPWWLWLRIDRVEEDGGFRGLSFQTDSRGVIEVKPSDWYTSLLPGYSEVSEADFTTAFLEMRKAITLAIR